MRSRKQSNHIIACRNLFKLTY